MIDKKKLIRRLSLAAYFLAVFLVFLLLLFPYDRLKYRLESTVRQRTSMDLSVARISPRFFNSFRLSDVVLSDKKGRVLFESPSLNATVSLFDLLRSIQSLDLKARAYGGDLAVRSQEGPGRRYLKVDADNLDVAAYQLLTHLGFKVAGKLGGNFEMTGDSGKGRFWLKGLTSRGLTVRGFPIPDLDFDQCWFEADLKADRLTVRKLELDGKELKVRCTGDLVLRERGSLNLTIKFKPSERLAREQSGLLSLLKTRDSEGYYQLILGGTVTDPFPRL